MADMDYLALEMRLAHQAIREALGYVNEASDAYSSEHADAEVKALKDSLDYADKTLAHAESTLSALLEHLS